MRGNITIKKGKIDKEYLEIMREKAKQIYKHKYK